MKFSGLTDREVEHSRQQYGSNAIPDSQPTTFWEAFKETCLLYTSDAADE